MVPRAEHLARVWKLRRLSVSSLVDRVILQKTIYLLAILGHKGLAPYLRTYSMYIYGPYSPEVARDAYSINESGEWKRIKMTASEVSEVEKFSKKLDGIIDAIPDKEGESPEIKYELLADIIYFSREEPRITEEELFSKLREKHSYFDDSKRCFVTIGISRQNLSD